MNFQELKAIALANPKGKIVASGATGNDIDNVSSWVKNDTNRDRAYDIMRAAEKLSSIPSYIVGDMTLLTGLSRTEFDSIFPVWFLLLPLFKDGGNLWECPKFIQYDPEADPGIVLLVGTEGDVVYIDTR